MSSPVDLAALHDALIDQLNQLTTSDAWLGWLRSARQFHRYSPANQLLLQAQGAQGLVASYKTWQRIPAQGGGTCQVRRGEHGMTILAPLTVTRGDLDEATGTEHTATVELRGVRPMKVFHQHQLVAPPDVPEPAVPQLLTGENRWQHVWAAVTSHIEHLGYTVELVSRSPVDTWNGRTTFRHGRVEIADVNEPPQRLKTLIHEWAHIALDHNGTPGDVHRGVIEVEAESVTYLVCSTIGLDSSAYSVPYLASWSAGDRQLVEATARRVLTTSAAMISVLESELSIDLTCDPLTVSRAHQPTGLRHPDQRPRLTVVQAADVGLTPEPLSVDGNMPADLRPVLSRLDDADQRQFLESLGRIDEDLDILTALCADAGLHGDQTRDLLLPRGADPDALYTAMTRHVVDSGQPDLGDRQPVEPLFPDSTPITPTAATMPDAVAQLDASDRETLEHFDMTRGYHVVTAAMLLPADKVSATDAVTILTHYGANMSDIRAALTREYHNHSTGQDEPRWPAADVAVATGKHSGQDAARPTVCERSPAAGPADEILEQWAAITNSDPTPSVTMP